VPNFLQSENGYALYLPPFWFLGIYQRLLEGPSALLIYTRLSHTGTTALIVVFGLACLAYPFAYLRKIRQLVEGPGRDESRAWLTKPVNRVVHALLIQQPISRAVFHFIHQTIMRVQRYRIYLVLYGGVGLSVVLATILRITVVNQLILIESSADGIRSALGIVPFWMITGLSIAFISPGNQKGSWIFRIVHGRPVYFEAAIRLLRAQKFWVMLWTTLVTFAACALMCAMAPPELKGWPARSAIFLVAGGMCLLLTDLSFLNVKIIAFTGEPSRESSNLAFTVLKYFIFVPVIAWLPLVVEPWIEMSRQNFAIAVAAIAIVHLLLRYFHRSIIREHCNMIHPEEDEEDFPMKLGLKYL
jgi:hypothetical protein